MGVDTNVDAMLKRGLSAKTFLGPPMSRMSLAPAAGAQGVDAIVYYGERPNSLMMAPRQAMLLSTH